MHEPPGPPLPNNLARGALSMVSAALLFAIMSVLVKVAARSLPDTMVVLLRSSLGFLMLLPWLALQRGATLRTGHIKEHLVRGVAGMAAMYCFFYALSHLALAEALLLNYLLPLFIPWVERAWLRQPAPAGIWRPLLLGALGLLLILKPGIGLFRGAALVGVLGALFGALAQVGVRNLTRTEPVTRIVFYFGVISTLVSLGPAAFNWQTPPLTLWPALLLLGVCATAAQLLMTHAYGSAPAARVGPFIYTSVLFAGLFDWWMFDKLPDRLALLGALLVIGAGVATLRATPAPAKLPR